MNKLKDISVKYYNLTGDTDFDVMVYAKNYSKYFPSYEQVAWRILRGQGCVNFVYPCKFQVGARYFCQSQIVRCGPIDAEPGTTWEVIHESPTDTPVLRQGKCK